MTRSAAPPGPRDPSVLQTVRLVRTQLPYLQECEGRYGPLFRLRISVLGDLVVVSSPELLQWLFTSKDPSLRAGASWGNRIYAPIVGKRSILGLDGDAHMAHRRMMLPPFHGDSVRSYQSIMAEVAAAEVDRWPIGTEFPLLPRMTAITLRVIMRAIFGFEGDARIGGIEEKMRRLLELGHRVTSLPYVHQYYGPWSLRARFERVRRAVDELLFAEIESRRADPRSADRTDVLSLLLQARDEDGTLMSDLELRDELITLLMAGHDTTAIELAWAFERLLRHSRVLDDLRESLAAGDERLLDGVIKETLRLRPVFNFVMRKVGADMELGSYRVRRGATIGGCLYLTHHRPDLYPDPEAFRPERFLDGDLPAYSWVPFGGGSRRCLGASFAQLEMRTVIRAIIERAELSAPRAAPEVPVRRSITSVPSDGTVVVLRGRLPRRRGALATTAS
jgi:cytochrome P450